MEKGKIDIQYVHITHNIERGYNTAQHTYIHVVYNTPCTLNVTTQHTTQEGDIRVRIRHEGKCSHMRCWCHNLSRPPSQSYTVWVGQGTLCSTTRHCVVVVAPGTCDSRCTASSCPCVMVDGERCGWSVGPGPVEMGEDELA